MPSAGAAPPELLQILPTQHPPTPAPWLLTLQREELASVEVAQLMLGIGRRCPSLGVQALDSEAFFGVTLSDLEAMAAGVAEAGGGDRGAAPEADETGGS